MKKVIALVLTLSLAIGLSGCSETHSSNTSDSNQTVIFHDKTFNKADLSQETIEWLEWYNELDETEQLSISYIPHDLYEFCGYVDTEDGPAETNAK